MGVVLDSKRHSGVSGHRLTLPTSDPGYSTTVAGLLLTFLLALGAFGCGTALSSATTTQDALDGGDASAPSSDSGRPDASMADAADRDASCVGVAPGGGCSFCACVAGQWLCGATQCPPDASRIDDASSPTDASGASDAPATDGSAHVSCGGSLCGAGEWCDTNEAAATCRCGLSGGACGAGAQCCAFPQGCAVLHCNEHCAATCP
jgi:hypothetical protein